MTLRKPSLLLGIVLAATAAGLLGGAGRAAPQTNVYTNSGPFSFVDCCANTSALTGTPSTAASYGSGASIITVSDLPGKVVDGLTAIVVLDHPWPDDVDLLLVGPGATPGKVILMSDAGGNGGNAIRPDTLTFSTGSPALSDASQLATGPYSPTNLASGGSDCDNQDVADTFPAPAPASGYTTTLTSFNGQPANGTWTLYAVDDCNLGNVPVAEIESWSLYITPRTPTGVRIKSFKAVRVKVGAEVRWSTGAETNVLGYNVWRTVGKKKTKLNARVLPSKGTTAGGAYKLPDKKIGAGAATYQLQVIGVDGSKVMSATAFLKAKPKK